MGKGERKERKEERKEERGKYLKVGRRITTNVGLWGWQKWCNFALFFERWFIELYGVLYLRRIDEARKWQTIAFAGQGKVQNRIAGNNSEQADIWKTVQYKRLIIKLVQKKKSSLLRQQTIGKRQTEKDIKVLV